MNQSSDPAEIRKLLSQITDSEIDESVAVFTHCTLIMEKNTRIGKNVFINFDCVFLDLGKITIEDNVLIAPKVCLLSEGHPFLQMTDLLVPQPHSYKTKCLDRIWNHDTFRSDDRRRMPLVAAGTVVSKM